MKISPSLQQVQKIVMTQKLQQAIQVLAMNRIELQQFLKQAMEQNPILEIEEELEEEAELEQELDSSDLEVKICPICGAEVPLDYKRCPSCDAPLNSIQEDEDEMPDIDLDSVFDDTMSMTERLTWEEEEEDRPRDDIPEPISFQDYLMAQFGMLKLSDEESRIGETIIGYIGDDGLLSADTDQIADILGVEKEKVEKVLQIIQESLDPVGVGARDVRESLLIQLKAAGEESLSAKIVRDHFDDLLQNRIPKIAKDLNVEIDEVLEAIDHLRSFNPKPGNGFGTISRGNEIIPDVTLEMVDGEYRVISNDEGLPKLRINRRYLDMLKNKDALSPEDREWLENYWNKAVELMKMVEQRRQTVKKVTEAIFSVQRDFLEKGFKYLKPLTLKQIADMVGVHESTVSRVVNGKYVQTPMGVFELRQFFSSGLMTETGSQASSTSVKEMIREMIESEDPANPLSDSEIVERLAERGIKVARRTVNKYRAELGIPPSSKRRKKW
ncbi:TPA: RNA polymerase factor sigma-54 [Candidatus Poribacteria bacterium]|nr:RNA polymerase factor sigma-54 [Candidatus Poribacteria bacterium]